MVPAGSILAERRNEVFIQLLPDQKSLLLGRNHRIKTFPTINFIRPELVKNYVPKLKIRDVRNSNGSTFKFPGNLDLTLTMKFHETLEI